MVSPNMHRLSIVNRYDPEHPVFMFCRFPLFLWSILCSTYYVGNRTITYTRLFLVITERAQNIRFRLQSTWTNTRHACCVLCTRNEYAIRSYTKIVIFLFLFFNVDYRVNSITSFDSILCWTRRDRLRMKGRETRFSIWFPWRNDISTNAEHENLHTIAATQTRMHVDWQ